MNRDTKPYKNDRGCCFNFWGPFSPFFGGHTLKEAGSSVWLPTPIVALWRIAFGAFLLAVYLYYTIVGFYRLQFFTIWAMLLLITSFFVSGIASVAFILKRDNGGSNSLAFGAVFLFQSASGSAFFASIVFWLLLFDYEDAPNFYDLAPHGINSAFVLLDFFLAFRMEFRVTYTIFSFALAVVYTIFMWIRFAVTNDVVYGFLDPRNSSVGTAVAYHIGVFIGVALLSVFMVVLSRLNRCVKDNSVTDDEGHELA